MGSRTLSLLLTYYTGSVSILILLMALRLHIHVFLAKEMM